MSAWRFDGPNVNPDCTCPCGTCIDAIGFDPEASCPDCPIHGRMTFAELEAEWKQRTA